MEFWRFSNLDHLTPILHAHQNAWLLVFAFSIALVAALAMFPTVRSIRIATTGKSQFGWNLVGAISMALGIWGMHFTAMLEMSEWMIVQYDPWITLLSVFPAVIGCGVTLHVLARWRRSITSLVVSSLALALGLGGMHYTGMEAMQGQFEIRYDLLLFSGSIVLKWIVAAGAIWLCQSFLCRRDKSWIYVAIAAVALAAAVTSMHLAAMAATQFYESSLPVITITRQLLSNEGLVLIIYFTVCLTTGSLIIVELVQNKYIVTAQNLLASEEQRNNVDSKYLKIVSYLSGGILLADMKGRIRLTNPAAEKIFGFSEATLRTLSLSDLFEMPCISIFSDELSKNADPKRSFAPICSIKTTQDANGRMIFLECTVVPVWDGAAWFFTVNLRDISSTIERDEELKRIGAAIDSAEDAFVIAAIDGKIAYVNKAFETRYKWLKAEAIGQRSMDHLKRKNYEEIRESLIRKGAWHGRSTCELADGTVIEELTSVKIIADDSGTPKYFVTIIKDYSTQLALERKLGHSQKLESIGQLASGIAHEINTPIQYVGDNIRFTKDSVTDIGALIKDLTDVVERDGQISRANFEQALEAADVQYVLDEVPKALKQAIEGVDRVAEIVRAMKSFSHPESDMTMLDLNQAIQSTITVASNEWKYVATMETDFDSTLGSVACFPGPFNQVILNLLVNAAHAIAEKSASAEADSALGVIRIETESLGKFAEIRVSDSGTGMPDSVKKKVFDPFFTTKEVGKGTGQGLSIAHDVIVEKHRGSIEIESTQGVGTTFILRVPLEQELDGVENPAEPFNEDLNKKVTAI